MKQVTTFKEIENIINNENDHWNEKIGEVLTKKLGFEIKVFEVAYIDDKAIVVYVHSKHINIINDLSITILNPEMHNIANSDLIYVADGNNDIIYTVDDKNNNEVIISKQQFIELMNHPYNREIVNKAKELHNNNVINIINIYNNYCIETNQSDDIYYSFDEPEDFFNNKAIFSNAYEAVRAVQFGKVSFNDEIITFNGYGNLITMTKEEVIEEIFNYIDDDFIDYLKDLLKEYDFI